MYCSRGHEPCVGPLTSSHVATSPNLVWKQRGGEPCHLRTVDRAGAGPRVWRESGRASPVGHGQHARGMKQPVGTTAAPGLFSGLFTERLQTYPVKNLSNFLMKRKLKLL